MSEESIEIPWVLDPAPTLDDCNDNDDNISVDVNTNDDYEQNTKFSSASKRKKSILLAICSITFIAIAALGASIGRRNNNNKASAVVVSDICLKDEDVFITAVNDDETGEVGDTMNSNDLLASNDMFPLILSENDGPFRRRGLRRDIKNRALTMNTIMESETRNLQECDPTSPSNGVLPPQSLIQSPRFQKSAQDLRDPNFDSKRSSFDLSLTELIDDFQESPNLGPQLGIEIFIGILQSLSGNSIPQPVVDVLKGTKELFDALGNALPIKPRFTAGIKFDAGLSYNVEDIDNGTYVDVDTPIDINITYPGQNSFKCGGSIEIKTSLKSGLEFDPFTNIPDNGKFSIIPPFYRAAVGAYLENIRFVLSAGLSLNGCLVVPEDTCPDALVFDQDFNLAEQLISKDGFRIPLVELCEPAFQDIDDSLFTDPTTTLLQKIEASKLGLKTLRECGDLETAVALLETFIDFQVIGNPLWRRRFATFSEREIVLTPGAVLSFAPELSGTFQAIRERNLLLPKLNNGVLQVTGQKDVSQFQFDLLDIGAFAIPGFKPSFSFPVPPLPPFLTIDFGDISPTITATQKQKFEFIPSGYVTFNMPITMAFEVLDETGTKVDQGTSDVIRMRVGNTLLLTYPQELQEPVDIFNNYTIDGNLKITTFNEYTTSVTLRLLELSFAAEFGTPKLGPVIERTANAEKVPGDFLIEDYTAFLGTSTTSFPDESFRLDPERPILEIDLRKIHVSNLGDLMRSVTYQVDAQNEGDVDLRDLKLNLSVDTPSIGAEYFNFGSCIFSPMWNENSNFNGLDDKNMLASPGPDLTICETGFVQAEAIAKPKTPVILPDGCFDPSSTSQTVISRGFASSPIGTPVESGFNECTQTRRTEEAIVNVNIGPQPITSLQNFTLYGWDEVELLSSMATPSIGNVGSTKDMELSLDECTVDDDDSPVELRGTLHVGHDLKVDEDVNFKVDYAQVGGSVIIGKSSKSSLEPLPLNGPPLNVLGAISEESNCVSVFETKSSKSKSSKSTSSESTSSNSKSSKSCAANPVTIPNDKTLRPGVYSTVTILDGGIKRLVPGNYTIDKLVVYPDVQIIAMINDDDDIVELDIKKWEFRCSLDVEWNFKSGKSSKGCKGRKSSSKSGKSSQKECSFSLSTFGGSPKQFKVNYSGKKDLRFNGALLEGTLTAPEADVSLDFGSKLRGALYAKRVFMGAGTSFVSDDEIKGSRESKCSKEPVPVQTAPWKDDE